MSLAVAWVLMHSRHGFGSAAAGSASGAKVGKGLTIFTRVWLKGQDAESVNRFAEAVQQMPEVVECHLMAGDCDFLLRVVAADIDDYRRFQMEYLTRIPGVLSVKTDIPMQKVKLTSALPT